MFMKYYQALLCMSLHYSFCVLCYALFNCDSVRRLKVGLSWITFRIYGLPLY